MLFDTKEDIDLNDLKKLQPGIWIIFTGALLYCHRNNLPVTITSIISDRTSEDVIKKQTQVHPSGRGIDLRITGGGWTRAHVHRLVRSLNLDFYELGARSSRDGKSRAAIAKHDHIHLQCGINIDIEKFIKE